MTVHKELRRAAGLEPLKKKTRKRLRNTLDYPWDPHPSSPSWDFVIDNFQRECLLELHNRCEDPQCICECHEADVLQLLMGQEP